MQPRFEHPAQNRSNHWFDGGNAPDIPARASSDRRGSGQRPEPFQNSPRNPRCEPGFSRGDPLESMRTGAEVPVAPRAGENSDALPFCVAVGQRDAEQLSIRSTRLRGGRPESESFLAAVHRGRRHLRARKRPRGAFIEFGSGNGCRKVGLSRERRILSVERSSPTYSSALEKSPGGKRSPTLPGSDWASSSKIRARCSPGTRS